MKRESIIRIFVIAVIASALSNCAARRIDLLAEKTIVVERQQTDDATIGRVYVSQDGDTIDIMGRVSQHFRYAPGHIDLALVSPDEKVLVRTSVTARKSLLPRRGAFVDNTRSFYARIEYVAPVGSILKVRFHRESSGSSQLFDCDVNQVGVGKK